MAMDHHWQGLSHIISMENNNCSKPSNQITIWQCVKTIGNPCSSHQNSWDLWMNNPLKMVLIGIDPYPYDRSMICREIHLFCCLMGSKITYIALIPVTV